MRSDHNLAVSASVPLPAPAVAGRRPVIWGPLLGLATLLLAPSVSQSQSQAEPASLSALPVLRVFNPAYMDTTVHACVDFFQFANGGWMAHDTIPAAYSTSGVARDMSDRNELVVRSVLDDASAHRDSVPATSTTHKLGMFYATCMDSAGAETQGVSPVAPRLAEIEQLKTRPALVSQVASLQVRGINALFAYSPAPDPHQAKRYIAWLAQAGLGLPDRDYYTRRGAGADSIRRQYTAHIVRLFALVGEDSGTARVDAQHVLKLETALANASMTRVALREPSATDHPMSVPAFRALAPAVDWPAYAKDIGLTTPVAKLNVAEPAFFKRADSLLATAPMADWRAYLRFHVLAVAAPWLSPPFVQEDFAFRRLFTGATAVLPRWKRCERVTDRELGEALGEAYVAKTFSPEARTRAKAVIDNIRAAFGERLLKLTWMSDSTKAHALAKLDRVGEKVGYPDRWRDYSRLDVSEQPFVENLFAANTFEWQRVVNRPGGPVDTTEWDMTVPTVNAYYDGTKNEMVFPAGALAPQTFDPAADDAANYGALGGSWAGHELTHGFDDEGRHYDAAGNLRDWWAPADSARFGAQTALIVRQFDGYIQVDSLHVNGPLTLGENIADYGGLLTGYDAMEHVLAQKGRPGPIDGFTPEQRFFLAYAQSWRVHDRPEDLRTRVTVDPHAPERWRVNGPLSNMPSFAAAFGCKAGDPMVRPPDQVARIW